MAINDFVVKNMTSKIIKMLEVSKGNIENIINSLPNAIAIIKNDSGYSDPKIADGFDHGLAVIRKISHKNTKKRSFSDYFLDYDYYEKNKHVIMNIISLSDFFKKYTTYNNHANNSNKFWSK